MSRTFRRVSLRHFAAHKLRTAITVGGIALGVAVVVAMRLMHASVARSYERTVEKIAGKAALQITNGDVGVPEELLDEVKHVAGVHAAAASVQGFVSLPAFPGERLYVFGIDLLADQQLRAYQFGVAQAEVDDPLVFLAQPDSIAVSTQFLERTKLGFDDRLAILAPSGARELTVRASLDVQTGPASLFAGRFAVMDVFAAQRLFGFDRRFSEIDVGVPDGADVATVKRSLEARVGGRAIVEEPQARGRTLERMLTANRYGMTLAAMLAVVVGLYLIFNTMMVTVAQRVREIGCLRALGMKRAEVLRMIVLESLALGILGCLAGVPAGYGLAAAMAQAFALNLSGIYMMPIDVPTLRLDAASVALGVGLGLLSAVIAAIVPARQAVAVHPLEALRSAGRRTTRGAYGRAAAAGLAVIAAVGVVWALRAVLPLSRNASGATAILGLLVGASLLVPATVRAFALRVEPVLSRLLGPVGSLASRAIVDHIGRVAITCSAFLVSLAGALAIATWVSSFQRTLQVWMDGIFANVDLVISSGGRPLSNESTPLPGALVDEIAKLPGIARVDPVRMLKITHDGTPTNVIATDGANWVKGIRAPTLLEGDSRAAFAAMHRGEAVGVNEAFALRYKKRTGDVISLPSPNGEVRVPIAGVYFDPAMGDMGIVIMDRDALYRPMWRDDTVTFIEPALEPGADRQAVIEAIRSRWGAKHALFVVTMEQFRKEANDLLNQTMLVTYPLVGISIAIALLGVVNSLLASVLDRIREIGVLRAIGATRAQVARSIVVEATIIGLLGGVLAVAVGSVLGYVQIDVLFRGMFGMTVLYRYPTTAAAFSLVAALVLAAASGYLPGRSAGRVEIVKALEYE
jgi:putative ABC transport system permease protein